MMLQQLAMAPGAEGGAGGGLAGLLPFVLILGIVYFIMIAPMRKKQKALQNMISELKSGDKVITTGGILGTVVNVKEKVVQVRIADNVRIDVTKSAIAGTQPEDLAQ